MSLLDLSTRLSGVFAEPVEIEPGDERQVQLFVPFYFPDGDGLVVHLRDLGADRFEITDQAHTFMHLSYDTDLDRLDSGPRAALLESIRSRHGIEDRDGELVSRAHEKNLAQALYSFVQGLLEVSDLRNLDREVIRSTFSEDLESLLMVAFADKLVKDYVDRVRDPQGVYEVPFLLNGLPRAIAVFGVATDEQASRAALVAEKHRSWRPDLQLVAVERDQTQLSRKPVAWLSDAFDKQFSALAGREQDVARYLLAEYELSRRLSQA